MTQLIAEDMMVPSEPGIEIFVRNKRPANLAKYTAERTLLFVHGSTYPAHTGFDLPLGGQSWMDFIAVLNFILKRLNIAKLNLLGWSWGCTLMATTAIQNPDKVARLMLYAPPW